MTRLLALPLVVALSSLPVAAQDAKKPAGALDGVWREPLLPGEVAEDKLEVTFSGDEIAIAWSKAVLRGNTRQDLERNPVRTIFTITLTQEKTEAPNSAFRGFCFVKENQLFVVVYPRPVNRMVQTGGQMIELAPVTFRLEKLKK